MSLGGIGTWSTSIANWDDGLNHVVWPSVATDSKAYFGGTAGVVSLATPITVQNITFETSGYTVSGADADILTVGGTTPTITTAAGISATISSPVAGAALTKAGDGILILSSANTFTATNVSAGTLRLNGAGTPGAPGSSVSVSPGATLDLNGTNQTVTLGAGAGTIANNSGGGTSILTINSAVTGSPVIADSTTVPGGKVAVVTSATQQFLNAGNTYSGGTTVNAGFLYATTMTAVGTGLVNLATSTSGLLLNSGTFLNDITGPGYIFNNTNSASTITFTGTLNTGGNVMFRNALNVYDFASNGNSTLTGVVGGPGGPNQNSAAGRIIKSGTGTLTLAGANIYTGTTTVSAGVLKLQHSSALGTVAGGTTVATNAALQLEGNITIGAEALTITGGGIVNTGAIRNLSGTNTYGGTITLGGSTRFTADAGVLRVGTVTGTNRNLVLNGLGDIEITGPITTGSGTVNKDTFGIGGSGMVTFSGANTYTGATAVAAGILRLDYGTQNQNNSKLSDTTALILSGGTLDLSGGNHTEIVGATTLTASAASSVIRSSGDSILQMNFVTPGAGARVNFGGEGIATTSTTNTNGILPWARFGNVWGTNSTNATNGPITAFTAYVDVNNLGDVIPNGITNNARIVPGGISGNVTLEGTPLHQINSLQVQTVGASTTVAANNATDVFMIGDEAGGTVWQIDTSGSLIIGPSANHGILTTGNTANASATRLTFINDSTQNAVTINSSIADNDTDVVGLVKVGGGTLRSNGNNTYTGVTTVGSGSAVAAGGGTLILAGNHSATMGNVLVGNGTTLQLESPDALATTGIAGSQLQLFDKSTLKLRTDNAVTFNGTNSIGALNNANVTIDVNQLTAAGTGNTLTISPNGSIYANAVTFNVTGGNGYRLSVGTITGVGTNLLTLNPTTASMTLAGYGVSGTGARPSTITLGGTAAGNLVSGAILDPVSPSTGVTTVVKSDSSSWELAGTNTYTGTTTVSDGTLIVSGSISGSTVLVNGAGVLSGGTGLTPGIAGPITIAAGGTIAPGLSIGALSTAALSMSGTAKFALEINSTTASNDFVASAGTFALSPGGTVSLNVQDLAPSLLQSGIFPFISYASLDWNGGLFNVNGTVVTDYDALTNPDSTSFTVSGNTYQIDYNANDNTVALLAVPEPHTMVAMLAGITVLMGRRRRAGEE